jgi:hypothetical protein
MPFAQISSRSPHQLIQAVCRRPENYAAGLRDGHGAHRPIKHIGIVETTSTDIGIQSEIERVERSIFTFCRRV